MANNTQTVLVLDDDSSSRFVLRAILEAKGFAVLDVADFLGAVEICRGHSGPIDLVIADVILRGAGGAAKIKTVRELRPEMAVLFVSGYPLEYLERHGFIERGLGSDAMFLQKPFTAEALRSAVHNLIRCEPTGRRD